MVDVSRETLPPPDPEVAVRVFPADRLGVLERYAGLLATAGVDRGLIGPREVSRLWDRHLVNCGLLARFVREGATVADIGSGAGLPGLVLALMRPDLRVTLVEPMARRVAFLEEACGTLGTEQVEVLRGRAQDLVRVRPARRFDVVTSRALAALPSLVEWCYPLVAPGGQLLAMKGSSARIEIEESGALLRRLGARAEVVTSSVPGSSVTTVVRVVPGAATGIGWRTSSVRRRRGERA